MFLACFLVAEVMVVSTVAVLGRAVVMAVSRVPCWGRALVMAVSCWSASVVAEVSLVSTSPRHSCLSAKKFAQRTKNGPQSAFYGVPGELFRGRACEGPVPGELSRGPADAGISLHEICRGNAPELCWARPRRRPPTSRAQAPREPGKSATASCRRKTPTPRRLPTRSG